MAESSPAHSPTPPPSPPNDPPNQGDGLLSDQTHSASTEVLVEEPLEFETRDEGYLPLGWTMELVGTGDDQKWVYTAEGHPPQDHFPTTESSTYVVSEEKDFKDEITEVQIVDFNGTRNGSLHPNWGPPLTDQVKITAELAKPPKEGHWRWVHCKGLHAPTLKKIATATGWDERQFMRIFSCGTRASMEWDQKRNLLLVLFESPGMRFFCWIGGGTYPVLLTCVKARGTTSFLPNDTMERLFDFARSGCSRPDIVLRRDPSLMLYGAVRAIIQYMRYSAFEIKKLANTAYFVVANKPSEDNLGLLLRLKETLVILSLDLISFKKAAQNLNAAADLMHLKSEKSPDMPQPLISEKSRKMLADQMGLINLLDEELPAIVSMTDTFNDHVFNALGFKINVLLRLLAVLTAITIPPTIVSGILGINYFQPNILDGTTIAIVFAVTGGLTVVFVVVFYVWRYYQDKRRSLLNDAELGRQQSHPEREAFAKEGDIARANEMLTKGHADHPMAKRYETRKETKQQTLPISKPNRLQAIYNLYKAKRNRFCSDDFGGREIKIHATGMKLHAQ